MSLVKPYYVEISNKDSVIFYDNQDLSFYPNLNFSELWKLGISDNTKNSIWSYLHTLILSSFAIISKSTDIAMLIRKINNVIQSQNDDNSETTINQAKAIIQIASTLKKDKKNSTALVKSEKESSEALFDLDNLPDLSDDSDNEDKKLTKKDGDKDTDKEDLDFDPTDLFQGIKIGELLKKSQKKWILTVWV